MGKKPKLSTNLATWVTSHAKENNNMDFFVCSSLDRVWLKPHNILLYMYFTGYFRYSLRYYSIVGIEFSPLRLINVNT